MRWVPTDADRDEQGRIITDPPGHRSLAELLPLPATTEQSPQDAPAPTLRERVAHVLIAFGVVVGLAFVIIGSHGAPSSPVPSAPTASPAPTRDIPTATPRTIPAYWSPGGAAVPAPIHAEEAYHFIGRLGDAWAQIRLPGGGQVWVRLADIPLDQTDMQALAAAPDRATPTPAPTPIVIVQQAPPVQCWTVTIDVADEHGYPIGVATGESCSSRDAAQAEAEAEARQVKAAHEKR